MRKDIVVVIIVAVGFLLGFLFLPKKSLIISLACRQSASIGCHIDSCGECSPSGKDSAGYLESSEKMCSIGIAPVDRRGYVCRKVNERCLFRTTLRAPVCRSLSDMHDSLRIKLGIQNP